MKELLKTKKTFFHVAELFHQQCSLLNELFLRLVLFPTFKCILFISNMADRLWAKFGWQGSMAVLTKDSED